MTTSDPRWLQLVREESARSSIATVAARLGYSRTTISLALAGKYPGNTGKIEAKALQVLEPVTEVACPYLGASIPVVDCRAFAEQRAPTHNPNKMNHWRACCQCQNRCKGEAK
jgi:hypothetical protein